MPAHMSSTSNASATADRLILELSNAISAPSSGPGASQNVSAALLSIQKHSRSFGFSSRQCEQLLRLSLLGRLRPNPSTSVGGSSTKLKPPKTSLSLVILRCIVPRPRAKLGRQAVLDIIASLGPSPSSDPVKSAGLRTGADDSNLGPERVKVDSKIQIAALKLLCVLLESPCVPLCVAANFYAEGSTADATSRQEHREDREQELLQRQASQYSGLAGSLPTTFLTSAAKSALEKCYSTLFHFVDYQALRPHLCYLLCRLTKRRHVRHYRITKLMALRANSAPEAGISALLSTYANFYPDLLFPELLGGGGASSAVGAAASAGGLKFPDPDWVAAVLLAHARCTRREAGHTVESDDEAESETEAGAGRAVKKQRLSSKAVKETTSAEAAMGSGTPALIPIPNLVTIQPINSAQKAFGTHPSLVTELSSLQHLAHSLDRLVLPSQAAAMLGSGFGARLMRVAVLAGATIANEDSLSQTIPAGRRNRAAEQDLCWARLCDWLESVLGDELGIRGGKGARKLKLPATELEFRRLGALLRRAKYVFDLAEGLPDKLEELISSILLAIATVAASDDNGVKSARAEDLKAWSSRWDELAKEVLAFVPLITPSDLTLFQDRFMNPLEALASSSKVSLDTSATVLLALSSLLSNWGARDWTHISRTLDKRTTYRWGISSLDPLIDYSLLISAVSSRADALATQLIALFPRHLLIEHSVLSVYETLAASLAGLRTTASISPRPLFAFTLHATTIVPVSRLCGLVQDLRAAFEEHNNHATLPRSKVDGGLESKFLDLREVFFEEGNLTTLNSTVTLVANLIWLGKLVLDHDSVGSLPSGLHEKVLAELASRGEELGLKLATIANTPFSRAMSHLGERFSNVYCSQQRKAKKGVGKEATEEGWVRGPMTPKVIKAAKKFGLPGEWTNTDFRAYMMDWLEKQGVEGMYELLKNILVTFGSQLKAIRGETQRQV
ncbi:uncharacterized protein MEPE_04719 [Melanopsichium pennsylvanicum]|uniref:Mis6 domain-containing protein n=2 Tax=Melanopsichium pennsylvanicum TaxID=63383 RepID=A0AAJ5C6M4_9BASI|nr:mis6 domain-containing protein [Melanopsichium pennsylvanicum 4]SNX86010.1 uncharacterized protein MEPE_04719 [Melanopsichium pennsylvanicum]